MMSCSRLPALLGFSKFRTPNDELKQSIEHYQGIEPEFIENEPMIWGNLTEKLILAEAVKRLGCEIDNLDHSTRCRGYPSCLSWCNTTSRTDGYYES